MTAGSTYRPYEVIRGTDYIELLTSFPLGNTLVTGVFVVIDITDASGQTQSFRRTMYDRIGYVTRAQGGNVNVDPQSFTRPVVAELDVMTVTISPSRQALDDFTARKTRLQFAIGACRPPRRSQRCHRSTCATPAKMRRPATPLISIVTPDRHQRNGRRQLSRRGRPHP